MSNKKEKYFFCRACYDAWKTSDYHYNDDEAAYSLCGHCGTACREVPHYYYNLPKMLEAQKGKHTGPKTPEGKKRVSLNSFKHGLRTKQRILVAPAKKDKYPDCADCDYRDECGVQLKYCPVNLSLITRFAAAYESGDVNLIKEFAGLMQGNAILTLKLLFNDVFQHGTLKERRIIQKIDEDRGEQEVILELQGNPSVKRIPEFMQLVGMAAEQQMMTPAKRTEDDNVKGFLEAEGSKNDTLQNFTERTAGALEDLRTKLIQAATERSHDEALNQLEKENAGKADKNNE